MRDEVPYQPGAGTAYPINRKALIHADSLTIRTCSPTSVDRPGIHARKRFKKKSASMRKTPRASTDELDRKESRAQQAPVQHDST